MADALTQLQTCYDQLLDRMYATLSHVSAYHAFGNLPNQSNEAYHSPINVARRARERDNKLATIRKEAEGRRTSLRAQGVAEKTVEAQLATREREEIAKYDAEQAAKQAEQGVEPEEGEVFERNIARFSQDLMVKYMQIEEIIKHMPALGRSGEELEGEIRGLEGELRALEREREDVKGERDELLRRVEVAIEGMRRA